MPVPGTNISEENILGMLFKKHENLVNTNPSQSFKLEPNTNARPRVFPTEQLIAQDIPKNDTDLPLPRYLARDTNYTQKIAGGPGATNPHAKRFTSTKYPYIALYERILLTEKEIGISYFYSANGSNIFNAANNILTDAIPYTYDTDGTYNIKIEFFTGNPAEPFVEIAPNNINYPWLIDTDGGIVTFYCNGAICVNYPVYISFWRYEGTKGLIAASTSNKLEHPVIHPDKPNFTFSNEIAISNSPGNPDTITTAFAKMDDWLFTNMISQPPAPKKEGELTTPTEVRVMFSGPQQLYLLDMHVPVIKNINSKIEITSTTPSQTITALNKNTSFIPQATKVDGIVISKLAGNSGIETRATTTNGTSTTYRVYVYYNPELASNPTFTLEIWYANDSSYPVNKLSVPGLSFQTAYPPSAPTMNTPQTQSSSQINISWTPPIYVMYDSTTLDGRLTASTTDPSIQDYRVTYNPLSTVRYGGLYNNTSVTSIVTNTSAQLTSLLPGTKYNINVTAKNTANTSYGLQSADVSGTTNLPSALVIPPNTSTPIFTSSLTNGTISQVGSVAAVTQPVFIEGQTPLSFVYTPIQVHTQANAGSPDTGISTLELSNNMQTIATTLNGFPANTYTNVISPNLEITNIKTTDLYSSGFPQSQGFYLTAQAQFKLKNLPSASSAQQIMSIKVNSSTYSYIYYVEKAQAGQPTLTFAPIELPSTKLISGIPTLGSTAPAENKTITCYIDASNIGTYFYRRSGIFDIYGTPYINPHTQNTLPPSITPPSITGPVQFTVSLPLNITPTDYARGFTIKAKAHNGVISGQEQNVSVPLLIDSASYNASFPTTPPDPTNGFVTGMRCITAEPDVEPVPGTLRPTNTTYYDISNNLTSLDLPYLHGKYQVRNSQENTNTDFVNYGEYVYGGSDLTPLQSETGFRWVTYAWKIPPNKDVVAIYLKLKDFSNTARLVKHPDSNTISIQNNTNPITYSNNTDFKAFYRILSTNSEQNTIWMDINKADSNGNLTYYMDYNKVSLNGIYGGLHRDTVIPNINTVGDLIYKVISRIFTTTNTDDIYILIRLGIRMNFYGINFSDIQCSII